MPVNRFISSSSRCNFCCFAFPSPTYLMINKKTN